MNSTIPTTTLDPLACDRSFNKFEIASSYYINGPLLTCVVVVGLVGNLLCLATLNRPRNRLPQINQYLIALGLWDTSLIITSFFVYNLPHILYGRIVTGGRYVLIYPLCYMLSSASYTGSIWMVMISAVDRYFALCRPLAHRFYVGGKGRTKAILMISSLICLIYNAPRYLEVSVSECQEPSTGKWIPTVASSGLRTHRLYWICYKIVGGLLFYSAFPFGALTYLSLRVSCEVRRLTTTAQPIPITNGGSESPHSLLQHNGSVKKHHHHQKAAHLRSPATAALIEAESKKVSFSDVVIEYESRNGRTRANASMLRRHSVTMKKTGDDTQHALNFMLIAVLLKFLICHSLPTVLDIWESSTPRDEHFSGPVIDSLVDASNFLVVINSSVNIFVYVLCSRRFRFDLRKLLTKLMHSCVNGHLHDERVKGGQADQAHIYHQRSPMGNYRRRMVPPICAAYPAYDRHGVSSPRDSSSISVMLP